MKPARLAAAALIAAMCAHATTQVIVVSGLGGEPDYEQRFAAWAEDLNKTLGGAESETRVNVLSGAKASKQNIKAAFDAAAGQLKADDGFAVILIGHGTFDGTEYKLNIPGPDISATDLASMLDRIKTSRQLVVNATSASGGSTHFLMKPNRTVITATKTGTEKNATVFARYWIEALRDASADTDKNEVISALEAFKFAEAKTKQFYETNKRIATEHPMLDGGDAAGPANAGRFALLRIGSIQKAAGDPAKRALLTKREQLEGEIDRLKFQKAAMPTDQYKRQLQALLLELARTQAEIDK
jgi:hypothetical protein